AHRGYTRWVQNATQSWRHTDTGEALVKEVAFTGEEFGGERNVYLPDVVLSWTDRRSSSRISSPLLGSIDLKPPTGRTGNHRADGFSIVVDPQRPRGGHILQGEIVDLAPMVRRWLDRRTWPRKQEPTKYARHTGLANGGCPLALFAFVAGRLRDSVYRGVAGQTSVSAMSLHLAVLPTASVSLR